MFGLDRLKSVYNNDFVKFCSIASALFLLPVIGPTAVNLLEKRTVEFQTGINAFVVNIGEDVHRNLINGEIVGNFQNVIAKDHDTDLESGFE